MRSIPAAEIRDAVARLCISANCGLPEDVVSALCAARDRETGHGKAILDQILENERMARAAGRPCCQDTGLAVVFLDVGQEVHIEGGLTEAVNAGVKQGYVEGYLRKSSLTALGRENPGDNTPAVLHTRIVPGERIRITVAPKGFGSENTSRLFMLKPGEGREGVLNAILETARLGAPNACPPIVLGVGLGGTMEAAALLSKRQLLRPLGKPNPDPAIAALEREALAAVNGLGIGPMGMGGLTTALAVHIAEIPTHLTALPVAVNVQCHCARHGEEIL